MENRALQQLVPAEILAALSLGKAPNQLNRAKNIAKTETVIPHKPALLVAERCRG